MSFEEPNKKKIHSNEEKSQTNRQTCEQEKCTAIAVKQCTPCNKKFCVFHILVSNHDHKRRPSKKCDFEECSKKLPITAFPCHCGGLFCALHTPAEMHGCGFDYLNENRRKLSEDLEKVVGDKIRKI